MNRLEFSVTSRRAVAERLVLALFYAHFVASVTVSLVFVEMLCAAVFFFGSASYLPGELWSHGFLGLLNIPLALWLRHLGVRHLHFLEHEAILDAGFAGANSDWFLAGPRERYDVIHELVEAIEVADVWDRQAARQTAKQWVEKNRAQLDSDDLAYLRAHIGYLLPADLVGAPAADRPQKPG